MSERYILECIEYDKERKPQRRMVGVTMSLDMARFMMEKLKKHYDTVVIHQLYSIDKEVS